MFPALILIVYLALPAWAGGPTDADVRDAWADILQGGPSCTKFGEWVAAASPGDWVVAGAASCVSRGALGLEETREWIDRRPADQRELFEGVRVQRTDPRQGAQVLAAIVKRRPTMAAAWAVLAVALHRAGSFDEAAEPVRQAVERDPEHPLVQHVRDVQEHVSGSLSRLAALLGRGPSAFADGAEPEIAVDPAVVLPPDRAGQFFSLCDQIGITMPAARTPRIEAAPAFTAEEMAVAAVMLPAGPQIVASGVRLEGALALMERQGNVGIVAGVVPTLMNLLFRAKQLDRALEVSAAWVASDSTFYRVELIHLARLRMLAAAGRPADVVEEGTRAIRAADRSGVPTRRIMIRISVADALEYIGRPVEAVSLLDESFRVAEAAADGPLIAWAAGSMAYSLAKIDPVASVPWFDRAIALAEAEDAFPHMVNHLVMRGGVLAGLGRMEDAEASWQAAIDVARRHGIVGTEDDVLQGRALALGVRGETRDAQLASLARSDRADEPGLEELSVNVLMLLQDRLFADAVALAREEVTLAERLGGASQRIRAWTHLGLALQYSGDLRGARRSMGEALELAQAAGDVDQQVDLLVLLSSLETLLGHDREADDLGLQAEAAAAQASPEGRAGFLLWKARQERVVRRHVAALEHLEEAERLCAGQCRLLIRDILRARATSLLFLERTDEALEVLDTLNQDRSAFWDPFDRSKADVLWAWAMVLRGEHEQALVVVEGALSELEQGMDSGTLYTAWLVQSAALRAKGRLAEALAACRNAFPQIKGVTVDEVAPALDCLTHSRNDKELGNVSKTVSKIDKDVSRAESGIDRAARRATRSISRGTAVPIGAATAVRRDTWRIPSPRLSALHTPALAEAREAARQVPAWEAPDWRSEGRALAEPEAATSLMDLRESFAEATESGDARALAMASLAEAKHHAALKDDQACEDAAAVAVKWSSAAGAPEIAAEAWSLTASCAERRSDEGAAVGAQRAAVAAWALAEDTTKELAAELVLLGRLSATGRAEEAWLLTERRAEAAPRLLGESGSQLPDDLHDASLVQRWRLARGVLALELTPWPRWTEQGLEQVAESDQALARVAQARELLEQVAEDPTADPATRGRALLGLAELDFRSGDRGATLRTLGAAAAACRAGGDIACIGHGHLLAAVLSNTLGSPLAGRRHAASALRAYGRAGSEAGRAQAWAELGRSAMRHSNLGRADRHLGRALLACDAAGRWATCAWVDGLRSYLDYPGSRGRPEEAALRSIEYGHRWQEQAGRWFEAAVRARLVEGALARGLTRIETSEDWNAALPWLEWAHAPAFSRALQVGPLPVSEEVRGAWSRERAPLELLRSLASAGAEAAAADTRLLSADLAALPSYPLMETSAGGPPDLDGLKRVVQEVDTPVLLLTVLDSSLKALLLLPDGGLHGVETSFAYPGWLPGALERGDAALGQKAGRSLYDDVVAPFEPLLVGEPRLIIIPHGTLAQIPFAALVDPDGSTLVSRFELSILPSIRALGVLAERHRQRPQAADVVAVFQGDEVRPLDQERFSTSREEIGGGGLDRYAALVDSVDLLVFNTHGHLVVDQPLASHLDVQPSPTRPGRITVTEILMHPLREHPVVVLSACDTSRGALVADERVDLARAFLVAGASGVLATLWSVPQQPATTEMISEFLHLHAVEGYRPAAALATVQRRAMAAEVTPAIWAAFVWIGPP